jgi:hypothetical protein
MKPVRSMVLISNDPISITRGSELLISRFQDEIQKHGMTDEISISLVNDLDRNDVSPVVVIYPEAVMLLILLKSIYSKVELLKKSGFQVTN